jgi:hypothetical protein
MEKAYRVATYASLYVSEDQTNSANVQRQMKVGNAMSVFGSKVSFHLLTNLPNQILMS